MSKTYTESGQTRASRTIFSVTNKSMSQPKETSTTKNVKTIRSEKNSESVKNRTLKKSSHQWLARHLSDRFVAAAKKEGFISRAAYKLIEINTKYNIFQGVNLNVLDLGSAPGSWAETILRTCKTINKLVLIDLLELKIEPSEKFTFFQGDFTTNEIQENIQNEFSGKKINIITSDIAPNITGILDIDAANMLDILDKIIEFSKLNLVNNGILVSKIFHNSFDPQLKSRLRQNFKMVKLFKPEASRRSSSEIYIICTGFFPSQDSEK